MSKGETGMKLFEWLSALIFIVVIVAISLGGMVMAFLGKIAGGDWQHLER